MSHRPLTPDEKREIEESIDRLRAAMGRNRLERKERAVASTAAILAEFRAYRPKTARQRALALKGLVVYEGGKGGV